jgi:hypothetical protein
MATQAKIDIKSAGGTTLLSTSINEGAKGYYSLMQHDYIVLPFKLRTPIDFKIGSYVDLRGVFDDALGGKLAKMYYVTELQNPSYNTSTGAYEYQLRLNAYYWLWNNFIFKYTPESTAGEASWSLTAPLDVQLGVFLRNLSELGFTYNGVPYEYSIDSTVENKAVAMTYDNTRLLDALFSMGDENAWDCDVWVTENVIHFGRCEHGDAVKIEIGVEASDMTRNESRGTFATRIYAFGSTRNIPENYRETGNPDLTVNGIVQKRLMLPADTPYIDAYPDMQPFEVVESVVVFEDIYPKRIGTLSDVKTVDRAIEDGEGNQTGTFKAYQYKDAGLTFDEKYRLEGQELRIVFQSGKLNGLDFGVTFNPNGSNPAEQLWEIVANEDYGRRLPDEVMKPENGDKYILYGFNIKLVSDQYVPSAEQELKERAQAYVNKTKVDDGTYTVPLRASYVREDMISRTYDVGQKVNLVNPSFFGTGGRISRVIGWEMCLDIPSDNPVYTIGESAQYSRLTEIEDKMDSLVFNGQTYQGGGSGSGMGVYIIKTNDSTPASDSNVFSALRSLATFLRKDKPDSTKYLIKFLGGLISDNIESQDFASGPFGTGFVVKRDPKTGKSYIETDELYVRLKAYFETLEIKHLSHVGGRIVASPAGMECVRVELVSAEYETLYDSAGSPITDSEGEEVTVPTIGGEQAYRCYFKQTDGEKEIVNEFAVDDLAQCREFNVKEGTSHQVSNQYYWRRVIGVGEDYIDLSITDCDQGSMDPKAGDTIVTIGNKTDESRQHVVFLSSYDNDAPCIKLYSGINSYSMLDKEVTVISPNADKNVFTGKVVIKPGSVGYENLADAPDMTEINREIQNAKDDAASASQAASEVQQSVADLTGYVDGAFSDGIISESEAKAIATYINVVNNEKKSAEAVYDELYNNPYLEGSAKVGLANAKSAMFSAADALTPAIADGKATQGEKADVDAKYASFNTECASFNEAVKAAEKSIQDKLKGYADNAQMAADEANQAASNAQEDANEAKQSVESLNTYVDGAFKDGIITESEAKAIATYINTVNSTKGSMDSTYTALYSNPYLTGTYKSLLYSAKRSFDSAVASLTSSINKAIADGKTTETEKDDVDSKFTAFNNAYASLSSAIENANKAIQDKIKQEAADQAKEDIDAQIGEVDQSVKDEIAKQLGYTDYENLKYYAERGMSIIKGGTINTEVLEASLVITSQLIANAIMANTLNVNNKFKVYTDGAVDMSGIFRSLGGKMECIISDGYLRVKYNGTDTLRLSVNETNGMPELFMQHGSNYMLATSQSITFMPEGGKPLIFDSEIIGGGTVRRDEETGNLYIGGLVLNYVLVKINVSPENGGTTLPFVGGNLVKTGESATVEAIPADGYEFDRWSDGGARVHTVVWSANSNLTAYFTKIQVTNYTVTLKASPSGSGSVSGGGTYEKGTRRTVSATANSGYRFVRWSDDGYQSHTVTWDANKTLTAYFEAYTVTGDEIFSGTALTSSAYWMAYGSCSVNSVTGGVATLKFTGSISGSDYIAFNKGYLGSKLEQGHKYRLTMEAKASVNSAVLVGFIGYYKSTGDADLINEDAIFWGDSLTTSYKTFTAEFTATRRDSNTSDAFIIAVATNCTVNIRSISLKEA